jgi:hypothetical protein
MLRGRWQPLSFADGFAHFRPTITGHAAEVDTKTCIVHFSSLPGRGRKM